MASPILDRYREIAPSTQNFSDEALAEELRQNFYPDADPDQFKANVGVTRDITKRPIDRYRSQVPQAWGMSDQELVTELHRQYGEDQPVESFAEQFGVEFSVDPVREQESTGTRSDLGFERSPMTRGGESAETAAQDSVLALPSANFNPDEQADLSGGAARRARREDREQVSIEADGVDEGPSAFAIANEGARQGVAGLYESFYATPGAFKRAVIDPVNQIADKAIESLGGDPEVVNPRVNIDTGPVGRFFEGNEQAFRQWADEGGNREAAEALAAKAQKANQAFNDALEGDLSGVGEVLSDPSAWAGFIGQAAPSLAVAALSGGSISVIGWMEAMEAAKDAEDFERRTGVRLSPMEFSRAVGQTAAVNSILEKAGIDRVLNPGRGSLVTRALKAGTAEGTTEALQELSSNVAAQSYDPDRSTTENVLAGAMGGFGSGAALGSSQTPVQSARQRPDDEPPDDISIPSPETGDGPLTQPGLSEQRASRDYESEFASIDAEINRLQRDVIAPSRDPNAPDPAPQDLAQAEERVNALLDQRDQLTNELQQVEQDQRPQLEAPQQSAPDQASQLPDLQVAIAENQRRIEQRREQLRREGVPSDQAAADPTLQQLESENQRAAQTLSNLQERADEQQANAAIDRNRAPTDDALGGQIEQTRDESRQGMREEIQRLRQMTTRPAPLTDQATTALQEQEQALREPTTSQPDRFDQKAAISQPEPMLRTNGEPFKTERSARASRRFREAANPQVAPVDGGFGVIDLPKQNRALGERSRVQPDDTQTVQSERSAVSETAEAPPRPITDQASGVFPQATAQTDRSVDSPARTLEQTMTEALQADEKAAGEIIVSAQQEGLSSDDLQRRLEDDVIANANSGRRDVLSEGTNRATTGAPIRTVGYRVDGIAADNLYTGPQTPVLGAGEYTAPTAADAESLAPDPARVEAREVQVDLNRPLVIESDADWRAITREAGWESPNPTNLSTAQAERQAANLQRLLRGRGYDGVVVRFDSTSIGDFNQQGESIKTLRQVFSVPQAVKFGSDQSNMATAFFNRSESEASGLSASEAMEHVDGLMSAWRNAPEVLVAQGETDLPGFLQQRIQDAGAQGEVRGVIWDGRIYVIADNVSSRAEVEETIFHEVVRHYGMRQVLGENYNDFMDQVYIRVGRSAIEPFAEYNGLDLDAENQTTRARNRRAATEELLAHATDEQLGSRLWTRLVNLVTEWLRRMGFAIQMTGYEIRDVLQRAKMYVQDGEFVTGTSVVEKSRVYRGEQHLETEDEAVFARSVDPARDIKDRGPVKSPRGQNYVGVSPEYTIKNPRRTAPNRALILSSSNANNADAQSRALDVLLEKHPNPLSSERQWAAYANDAFGLNRLPMPPFKTIETINAGPSAIVREISQLSDGMRRDAEEGLKTAKEFGEVYASGQATADITGKAFLWSFLSRGVSPYVQESAFLDAIMSDELTEIMRRAAADGWSDELGNDYASWAENAIRIGSPGRGTQHNLNAFGRNFLRVMSQRHLDKDNKTGLEIIHEMISEGAPSFEIRREFLKRGSGAGIDNKVVSFTLLLLGRDDVLVLDRVQIRNQFNDGRFDGQNIYDIKTDENGKQIPGSGFAEMTFGHKGLLYYEAMERELKPIVEQAYAEMGMEGSLGRYHWDSWLLASNQEVGHASIEGLLREAQFQPNPYVGTFVRQGKYGNYDYGFRYGVLPDNTLGTVVELLDGDRAFVLPREVVANPESETRRAISRLATKAKKRDTNSGRTKPWIAALTAEERVEYDRAIESGGTPAPDLWAYDPNAAGRADQPIAAALDDGRAQRRRDTGEPSRASNLVVDTRGDEGRPEPVDGQTFLAAMQRAGETLGPIAAQVSTVKISANVQRFLLDDGLSGYALDGDNLIGVFKHASAPPGAAQRILADAIRRGARRLDGFNTMLPRLYAKGGFRAVARLPFDPQFAPSAPEALSDWDAEAMEAMSPGWGSPDVVFMVYDPQSATAETQNVVSSYEEGVAAQDSALESQPVFSRRSDDPDLEEAKKRAGLGGRRRPLGEWIQNLQAVSHAKARDFARETGHAVAQGAFDRFHGIKRIEQNTVGNIAAEQSAYVAARLSTGIATTMRAILHHGTPQWRDGVLSKIEGSKGLLEILEPVRGDIDTFLGWMVARRAERLYAEGRENLFEPRHIEALRRAGETSPQFERFEAVAAELDAFKKGVLDVAEKAGLIDPDARAAWDQADYIPFYRIADDSPSASGPNRRQSLSGQNSGIRTLRGGVERLNDPLENLIMNFTHLMDASMKNHAILQLRDNVNGFQGILEEVGPDFKPEMIPMDQVRAQIIRSGGDPSVIPEEAMQGLAKMWAMKPPADDDVIRVMDKGKARYYRVLDPMLLKSLTAIRDSGLQGLPLDFMRWTKRLLTRGVTADPAFMIRNYIRDMMHAWTISEDKFRLGIDSVRGASKTIRETGGTIDMMFAGGSFLGGYVNATDPREVARATRQALRQKGYTAASANQFLSTMIDTPLKAWEFYTRFGDSIENASREAVYEAAMRQGRSRSEAVFMAKDLMDYSMRGSNPAVQFLTDVVPFLNARLQGLYKLGRAGVNNPGPIFAKGSVIMLATLALLYDNKDDERYEQLEDWDKDTYWHFFPPEGIPGMPAHIRIPKPFEIGVLFGTIPERISMNALDKEGADKTFERMLWSLNSTFAFNPVPQAMFPPMEVFANRNIFTGAPIENLSDQNRLPEARYSPYTSETMQALGQVTGPVAGLSPKELQHLWRGYTGTLGMYALDAADMISRRLQDKPPKPAMRVDRMPVVKSFIRAEPANRTQFQTDLYDLFNEARQIQRTVDAYVEEGNVEKAMRLADQNPRKLAALPSMRDTTRDLGKIRDEITMIYQSEQMTPEEKREAIDGLISVRNDITRSQVKALQDFFKEDPLKEGQE